MSVCVSNSSSGLVIGFVNLPYITREETGFATVTVAIRSENVVLDADFVVGFMTNDISGLQNSAQGIEKVHHYTYTSISYYVILIAFQLDLTTHHS